jgi:hypothetical protein
VLRSNRGERQQTDHKIKKGKEVKAAKKIQVEGE